MFNDMSSTRWVAVKLVTNGVIAELPDLQCTRLEFRIGEMTSAEATLPWDKAPRNWLDATRPYSVAILLVMGHTVLWGGIVIKRQRDLGGNGIKMTLSTIEHYLDSVYVGDLSFRQKPQTEIAKGIVDITSGHRFYVHSDIAPSSYLRDRDYSAEQDKTLLSALQELSNVINGPDWFGTWVENDYNAYFPTIVIRDKIGSDRSNTVFDESVMSKLSLLEDYSSGYGANRVQATSSAEGGDSATSDWQQYDDFSRPVIERKFSAGTSIIRKDTLNEHARQELRSIQNGTNTMNFSVGLLSAPEVGLDWSLGDIVSYRLTTAKEQFPDYSSGYLRIIGYDLNFTSGWELTPMLRPVEVGE